jgi:small subunit ribosomal protein S21
MGHDLVEGLGLVVVEQDGEHDVVVAGHGVLREPGRCAASPPERASPDRTVPYRARPVRIDRSLPSGYRSAMRIEVHDNQIESALKTMKKLMLKDGLFKEMKKRAYYEKPSVKRKRKQAEARKKRRKAMKRTEQED